MRFIRILIATFALVAVLRAQDDSPTAPPRSKNPAIIKHTEFTFARLKYSDARGRRSSWATDYPDADMNFSARFQKITGLKTHTKGVVLDITDTNLSKYPFVYLAEGGNANFTQTEVTALRSYLTNGGFLMVDDFWGELEWVSLLGEMKRIFPDSEPVNLPLSHPIFHSVYEIAEKPQVPSIGHAMQNEKTGITWERSDAKEAHYRAFLDANGRIMALLCHNTDLADGWERVSEHPYYAREFSEKRAFPMGINIVAFALSQ